MEWLIQELDANTRKRVAQITHKLNRLDNQNDADAFLNVQDICCSLESYMRELRRLEYQVVECWRDAHSDYCIADDDFHFPDCRIGWDEEILRIRLGAVLPFKTKLRCDLQAKSWRKPFAATLPITHCPSPYFPKP